MAESIFSSGYEFTIHITGWGGGGSTTFLFATCRALMSGFMMLYHG